ncbi:DsbE family thiol:disulfide interchange protein [Rodentibacter caecimuris]|uniref:Thiol:disulfide interchange protein n=1 Tax=Rodentibacter caecimuris TaxID=1796644 RepID=A0ABX3L014_9PAST|nr:thiol:disulfide interchange protein [Rodentibacter heylii]
MNKKILFFLPLLGVLGICFLLLLGLNQDPRRLVSAFIDKPIPEFYQADLNQPNLQRSSKDFPHRPFLLNVWGSWCQYCKQEHPLLMQISQQFPIIGINYRDKTEFAIEMLERYGNPYLWNIKDSRGEFALKLGVDGAPETYLVDQYGVIRYRHSGLLDKHTWQTVFIPKINQLIQK